MIDDVLIGFILLLSSILCIGGAIGGAIGGLATAGSLWHSKDDSIKPKQVFLGWVVAMSLGAVVYFLSNRILSSLEDLILENLVSPSHYYWYWSVIAEVFAWCLAGATIGLIGAKEMFAKDDQISDAKEK